MTLRQAITFGARAAARLEQEAKADRGGRPLEPLVGILGKLTGSSALGSGYKRYLYDWEEAEITSSDVFQLKSGGRSGKALNLAEAMNTSGSSGTVAHGVSEPGLPGTFDPVPADGYVWLVPLRRTDGTLRWLFDAPVIDGEC